MKCLMPIRHCSSTKCFRRQRLVQVLAYGYWRRVGLSLQFIWINCIFGLGVVSNILSHDICITLAGLVKSPRYGQFFFLVVFFLGGVFGVRGSG
ncbi:hypothetical protein EUGRSUZ_J01360 [Eucalyptus grandis]|uniref:Uncharacterized protein n=2 Tax=Eucalyptus grandis TaxID=71139 RepID=A0A059ADK2_EUCGR|nr:hypothetical protein EUGRSUZ_J01360 [Eucalyptus grandis]